MRRGHRETKGFTSFSFSFSLLIREDVSKMEHKLCVFYFFFFFFFFKNEKNITMIKVDEIFLVYPDSSNDSWLFSKQCTNDIMTYVFRFVCRLYIRGISKIQLNFDVGLFERATEIEDSPPKHFSSRLFDCSTFFFFFFFNFELFIFSKHFV